MIRALICDLGNVLLHFDHQLIVRRLAAHMVSGRPDAEFASRFWPSVHAFEHGQIDADTFRTDIGTMLGSDHAVSEEEFHLLWGDIFWPNGEFIDALTRLRERLTLVLLSNTNSLHIRYATERFPELFSLFDAAVYSFATGTGKPDPAMYRTALARAGVAAEQTLYFDDMAAYVDAAAALGMHAYQYVSFAGARDVLRMYDLVPD